MNSVELFKQEMREEIEKAVFNALNRHHSYQQMAVAQTASEQPDLCDIEEAAKITGLSVSTLYQKGAKVPRIKTAKKVFFSKKALLEWVQSGMPDVSLQKAGKELAFSLTKGKHKYANR